MLALFVDIVIVRRSLNFNFKLIKVVNFIEDNPIMILGVGVFFPNRKKDKPNEGKSKLKMTYLIIYSSL